MGVHENIGFSDFPDQSQTSGKAVEVCFNYDSSKILPGTCVRDDLEEPFMTIIKLDDGRHVLSTECQFRVVGPCF
ncbi:hypothetical protein [Arsukibacterium indicum]|uniref:Uncharacterized protein n=1 Tax=Arsukibacterium indicum TaxID=2848612 RepID=A0ABS6MHT8_9GAMM|nr:hypothetical protein [Arsukibacterium indicum]MBV2127939.1 hypothetical protein [Arsukibacterium indicum]